jgi:hypothetical protein
MYSPLIESMLFDGYMKEAEYSITLGDTLDMKANIWLVVITFLATQTAYFLSKELSVCLFWGQVASAFLLVIAGLLSLWELMPRDYLLFRPSEGAIQRKLEKLRNEHKESTDEEKLVEAAIMNAQMEWAKERIEFNMRINRKKSALIDWSFWLAAAAFVINFVTLASLFKPSLF